MLTPQPRQHTTEVQRTSVPASFWELAQQQLPTAAEIRTQCKARDTSPYCSALVGIQCLQNFSCTETAAEFFEALNHLSSTLRGREIGLYEELGFSGQAADSSLTLHHLPGNPTYPVTYLGSGHHGSVYRIETTDGSAYALKVFYRRDTERDFSGPYSEAALGAFITAQQVSDMPWLCLAQPAHGWILTEFIDDAYRSKNPAGPAWSSLGLITMDPQRDESNSIETSRGFQFRVDYGHLITEEQREHASHIRTRLLATISQGEHISKEDYLNLYQAHPDNRHELADALFLVPGEDRLEVLTTLYRYPDMQYYLVSDYQKAQVFQSDEIIPLFQLMMKHSNPLVRSQAVFDLRTLSAETADYLREQWKQHHEFSDFMKYCTLSDEQ